MIPAIASLAESSIAEFNIAKFEFAKRNAGDHRGASVAGNRADLVSLRTVVRASCTRPAAAGAALVPRHRDVQPALDLDADFLKHQRWEQFETAFED